MHLLAVPRELGLPVWRLRSDGLAPRHRVGRAAPGIKDYDVTYLDDGDLSWEAADVRPLGGRRRHQRGRDRPRPPRTRLSGAAVREGRSRRRDLLGVQQAGAWRAALSRARRFPPGARVA